MGLLHPEEGRHDGGLASAGATDDGHLNITHMAITAV